MNVSLQCSAIWKASSTSVHQFMPVTNSKPSKLGAVQLLNKTERACWQEYEKWFSDTCDTVDVTVWCNQAFNLSVDMCGCVSVYLSNMYVNLKECEGLKWKWSQHLRQSHAHKLLCLFSSSPLARCDVHLSHFTKNRRRQNKLKGRRKHTDVRREEKKNK